MPQRRSKKSPSLTGNQLPGSVLSQKHENDQNASSSSGTSKQASSGAPSGNIKSNNEGVENENLKPINVVSSIVEGWNSDAAALYDELNLFRQKWKSEIDKPSEETVPFKLDEQNPGPSRVREPKNSSAYVKPSTNDTNKNHNDQPDVETYEKAKKLFMIAVQLEQDEMHYDSIKYYKQAMHLCPDIEKLTFREQCEASAKLAATAAAEYSKQKNELSDRDADDTEDQISLYTRICESFNSSQQEGQYQICRPASKLKNIHISQLPHELILQIFRYVIGKDLDLASLETLGLVCRGFYIISRDQALWKSICYNTWSDETSTVIDCWKNRVSSNLKIDWIQLFLEQPRVNHDGVYISRTRYIRHGDVDFQDLTYRPFHVIHYYRYFRFFPDRKVLILTTNEEPDRIIPIFRHATHSKHFSPDLSILTGTFELTSNDQVLISAEKVCQPLKTVNRRGVQLNWTRQTPLSQQFNLKFQLKTVEHKPYRNNSLKWLSYTIISRMDTGLEVTNFDLTPETFPNMSFCRVKKLSLKLTSPLL